MKTDSRPGSSEGDEFNFDPDTFAAWLYDVGVDGECAIFEKTRGLEYLRFFLEMLVGWFDECEFCEPTLTALVAKTAHVSKDEAKELVSGALAGCRGIEIDGAVLVRRATKRDRWRVARIDVASPSIFTSMNFH